MIMLKSQNYLSIDCIWFDDDFIHAIFYNNGHIVEPRQTMDNYITLGVGRIEIGTDADSIIQGWLGDVKPGAEISKGHGNDIDAMRHGGTAALAAYRIGYQETIRLGVTLENFRPGPEAETRQDLYNNRVGASIGYSEPHRHPPPLPPRLRLHRHLHGDGCASA